jgi:hypothetical protein
VGRVALADLVQRMPFHLSISDEYWPLGVW